LYDFSIYAIRECDGPAGNGSSVDGDVKSISLAFSLAYAYAATHVPCTEKKGEKGREKNVIYIGKGRGTPSANELVSLVYVSGESFLQKERHALRRGAHRTGHRFCKMRVIKPGGAV
jgi:hypothetical protein